MWRHRAAATVCLSLAALASGCAEDVAPSSEAPPRPAAEPVQVPSVPDLAGLVHSVDFIDGRHGMAVLSDCVANGEAEQEHGCRHQVLTLEDGAWRRRPAPVTGVAPAERQIGGVAMLGAGRAVLGEPEEDPSRVWFTADGGRTWRRVDSRLAGVVQRIPRGAVLSQRCWAYESQKPYAPCVDSRVLVTLPEDGRRRLLASQPPLAGQLYPQRTPAADGSWWVSGRDPKTAAPAVAVSRDAGRTWTASKLPSPERTLPKKLRPYLRGVTVVTSRHETYAAEAGQLPEETGAKNGLRAIHRSDDGGRTWTRVWDYRRGEPRSILGLVLDARGAVTVHGELSTHRSTDGGRSFTPVHSWQHASVRWTRAGYLMDGGNSRFQLSRDGLAWREFTLGGSGSSGG